MLNRGTVVYSKERVSIGPHANIADFVMIADTLFHRVSPDGPVRIGAITLGRNVWVGHGASIMPGVTIGDHSVIGVGSVVTKGHPRPNGRHGGAREASPDVHLPG